MKNDQLLSTLARWNRWGGAKLAGGIEREVTARVTPFLHSPEVVAFLGPRRAGKTIVLFQVMDVLEQSGISKDAMLHVNFEEPALSPELSIDLLEEIYTVFRAEICPTGRAYLFLDEIQNVPHWEKWVRARNESEDIKLFITGSSSQLMSRELGTLLTGRHISFTVFPLNFKEFLHFNALPLPEKLVSFNPPAPIAHALIQFLRWGGFPEIVLASEPIRKELLLKQYFDDILFKDVAMRHRVRDVMTLRNLAVYLLTQTGSLVSLQRISKMFEVSLDLARAYCHYLQEAFLIDFVPFYSLKMAERNRNPQKSYVVDLGLRYVANMAHSADKGRIIETAVYHALQQKKQDGIFYWKKEKEIDFLIRQGNSVEALIQVVSEGLEQSDVAHRELSALDEAHIKFPHAKKIIISGKAAKETKNQKMPKVIPFWHFLLS